MKNKNRNEFVKERKENSRELIIIVFREQKLFSKFILLTVFEEYICMCNKKLFVCMFVSQYISII